MFCTKCGHEISETEKVCSSCGSPNSRYKEEKIQPQSSEKKEPITSKATESASNSEKNKKETNPKIKNEGKKAEKVVAQEKVKTKKEQARKERQQPKTKSSATTVIVVILIIALLAGAGGGAWYWYSKKGKDDEQQEKTAKLLEWGDIYVEVLKDKDKKLEDMDDQQIQLLDIDNDEIPELIIYGIKNTSKYIANIYKINEKDEVDTIKVELDQKFDLKFLYNFAEDTYKWYAVTNNAKATTSPNVYNLNIETKTYKPEKLDVNYETEMMEIKEKYSQKVDFNKDASNKDVQKIFEEAEKGYVPSGDLITKQVKNEVKLKKEEMEEAKKATPEPTITPTPTPVPTPTSTTTNSDKPSQAKITMEEALKLAQKQFGDDTSEPPMTYYYCGWGVANGKQYYVFDMRWNLGDHLSYVGTVCISVDGTTYEQMDMPQGNITNGSTLKLSEGYGGTI